jgi:N-acetylglucosamine-6-phosphate deacetylase
VPTLGSSPLDELLAAARIIHQARLNGVDGAEILGIHVEGRYLSPDERGAHPQELLVVPNPEEYDRFLEYAEDIRVWTLAPELPGAIELIRALHAHNILVSAGHSIAIDDELSRAVDAGLSHATHMFCNMGTLRRVNIRRVAGLVESVLADRRITTEIITDGYHIAPSLMKLAFNVKGRDNLAIVTDGSALTGLPPGPYSAYGRDVILEQDITYVSDRSAYAGSAAPMDHCLRCAMESFDLPLNDALQMASLTPATILGVADRKGSLERGKDADIVVLNNKLQVTQTIVGGKPHGLTGEMRVERAGRLGCRVVPMVSTNNLPMQTHSNTVEDETLHVARK